MKRLKLLILLFCVSLSIPLAWFVMKTYKGLEQEEIAELRFFAETLFNEMEDALAERITIEEKRAVDDYNFQGTGVVSFPGKKAPPLSGSPDDSFVIGYFQNNPDGSFQTPLAGAGWSKRITSIVAILANANRVFNKKRTLPPEPMEVKPSPQKAKERKFIGSKGFADKYLDTGRKQKPKTHLGTSKKRVERITIIQAMKLERREHIVAPAAEAEKSSQKRDSRYMAEEESGMAEAISSFLGRQAQGEAAAPEHPSPSLSASAELRVEIDPMQSVFIDKHGIFIFRRIVIDNRVYRQGFLIDPQKFLRHLANKYFYGHPMANFTHLSLRINNGKKKTSELEAGPPSIHPKFSISRSFPRPFSFLHADLTCDNIPKSPARRTLAVMIAILTGVIMAGLFAIYQSTRSIVDLSRRRSGFVSSVTHELKTPLTNIRMYIEMLEQGIARTADREQEYYRILKSESGRLARLINNVLEFSRIEKKQFRFEFKKGDFSDVFREVREIMEEKLRKENFVLEMEKEDSLFFQYDREVMIQMLINLIENSMKFGRHSEIHEIRIFACMKNGKVNISVSDKGPGIPKHALKKVFDDFYRVDDSMTRTTRGTGIGLAFVKKCVVALGGSVQAKNNEGQGCIITITLPESPT